MKTSKIVLRIEVREPSRMMFDGYDAFAHVMVCFNRWNSDKGDYEHLSDYTDGAFQVTAFSCQIDASSKDSNSYGWTLGLRGGTPEHPCAMDKVEDSLKLMRKLRKAYDEMCKIAGNPMTFGQFVAYHTSKLRMEVLVKSVHGGLMLCEAADLTRLIDTRVTQLREKCQEVAKRAS